MSKRNAIRLGPNPHSAESVIFTIRRYGILKKETLDELILWLEEHKDKFSYKIEQESIFDAECEEFITFPVLKTHMHTSAFEKYIDNEYDAQNALANIRNKDFPHNKQGE